jgi:hypothetical protein
MTFVDGAAPKLKAAGTNGKGSPRPAVDPLNDA